VTNHDWSWYLERAYQTAEAMVEHAPHYAQFGQMGGTVFLRILEDLNREGWTEQAAALVAGKGKALPSRLSAGAGKLFDAPSLLVGYFDFSQVVSALSGLDASAFGQGGIAVKMILDMALGAVKNLGELTGQLRIEPDGMAIQTHLRIQ